MEDAVVRYALTVWAITVESAPWVVVSLVFGGLIREFLPASGLQRLVNRRGIVGMGGAVTLGALLPICSCGVVPLAISLYRAGVRIGQSWPSPRPRPSSTLRRSFWLSACSGPN
jgi:uncharacterized protein